MHDHYHFCLPTESRYFYLQYLGNYSPTCINLVRCIFTLFIFSYYWILLFLQYSFQDANKKSFFFYVFAYYLLLTEVTVVTFTSVFTLHQRCGTVLFFMVPVPTFEKLSFRFRFRLLKKLWFRFRFLLLKSYSSGSGSGSSSISNHKNKMFQKNIWKFFCLFT